EPGARWGGGGGGAGARGGEGRGGRRPVGGGYGAWCSPFGGGVDHLSQTCIDHLCGQPQLARITRWVDRISARGGSPRSSMRARSRAAALRPRSLSGWLTVVTAGVTIRLA